MKNKSILTALSFGLGLAIASTAITPAVAGFQEGEMSKESMKKHKFMKKGDMSKADMKAMMDKKMHMMKVDGKPEDSVLGFHDAMKAGEGDKVLSYLHEDVIIFEGGHINPSKENYKNTHLQGDMRGNKPSKDKTSKILNQNVSITGMTATVMTSTETKGIRNDEAYTRHGTETMVLSSESGKWLITHIHWSGRTVKPKK